MPFIVTSWAPKVHRTGGSGRGRPSVIMHIGFFACSRHISRTHSFQENHPFIFQARAVLKPLVSLIGRHVSILWVCTRGCWKLRNTTAFLLSLSSKCSVENVLQNQSFRWTKGKPSIETVLQTGQSSASGVCLGKNNEFEILGSVYYSWVRSWKKCRYACAITLRVF